MRFFYSFLLLLSGLTFADTQPLVLPDNLTWQTNTTDSILGAANAKKGGRFTQALRSYPLTFRTVGPDANSGFRSAILDNQFGLTAYHPISDNIIPVIASHWAYDSDGKTVYYKINPKAKWSDGQPVTADDFVFTLEFMRSKHIVAPWYNNYYSEEIERVSKYDDYTLSITGASVKPQKDLHYYYAIPPTAKHFYVMDKDWVRAYNWRIAPNTGPYQISKFKSGKYVEFERKKDWWAKDLRYFKGRYNPDTIRYQVIRDNNVTFQYFEKGYIDTFGLTLPSYWVNKTKGDVFKRGLVNKITFYTNTFQPLSAIYLNQAKAPFDNKNVRYGVAHSLNFNKVINTVLRGDYTRSNALHIGFGQYSNTAIKARTFDLDKADNYFKQAGFIKRGGDGIRINEQGLRLSFKLLYGADHHTERLIILKEEAKKAGLELVLQKLESSSFYKSIMEKQHQAAWMAWGGGFRPQYWGSFHSQNANKSQTNNITNTQSPVVDALIENYRNGTVEADRINYARQIEQFIHDEGTVIPRTYVPFVRAAYWRWLQLPDFVAGPHSESPFEPFGDNGGFFWIDETLKAETLNAKKSGDSYPIKAIVNTHYKPVSE